MPIDPSTAVYDLVRTIPRGCVATYGQVAGMVEGISLTARQVGGIMYTSPPDIPWQRVVGAGGHLPIGKRSPEMMIRQRRRLEQEGVGFLDNDRIDMAKHQWLVGGLSGLFDE